MYHRCSHELVTSYDLSDGFLEKVMSGDQIYIKPVFQVIAIKKLINFSKHKDTEADRYRLKLSDGKTTNPYILLATSLNHLITNNFITERAIIRITRHAMSILKYNEKERAIMVILCADILIPGLMVEKFLGNIDADEDEVSFIEEKLQNIVI